MMGEGILGRVELATSSNSSSRSTDWYLLTRASLKRGRLAPSESLSESRRVKLKQFSIDINIIQFISTDYASITNKKNSWPLLKLVTFVRKLHYVFLDNLNMKNIIELERKTSELTQDIKDILHAADINFQALVVEAEPLHPALPSEFSYLHSLLKSLQTLLGERSHLHMGYLITRQIQEEEERVRRERLADYEEKIYDQRRIISDKEGFFESLLRPKKKRLPTQNADQFQEARAKEKEIEERAKGEQLAKQLAEIQALKRLIEEQERDSVIGQRREKNCSISNVNSTALSMNEQQFATEKILPLPANEQKSKDSPKQHVRTNSLQHSIVRETTPKQGEGKQQQCNLGEVLTNLLNFKNENEELHRIYDQECLALKFKKQQNSKLLTEYQNITKELADAHQKLKIIHKEEDWRRQRCYRPIKIARRANSSQKSTR